MACSLALQGQSLHDPARTLRDPDRGVLTGIAGAVSSGSCQVPMGF